MPMRLWCESTQAFQDLRPSHARTMEQACPKMNFADKKTSGVGDTYKTFQTYLSAIYSIPPVQSLNLVSDYDQLLFGLALAAPLPFIEDRNLVVQLPMVSNRQAELLNFKFQVQVD